MEPRYDNFQTGGYWWAINFVRQHDQKPEIIDVLDLPGLGVENKVADRLGEADHYDIVEFFPLKPIDTTGWPEEQDSDSPKAVDTGYYWAIYDADGSDDPEIVLVSDAEVLRTGQDRPFDLDEFKFIRRIDTKDWPQSTGFLN